MNNIQTVVLDRDGVINFDSPDYILSPEQWLPIPGSLEAIAKLKAAGKQVTVCSNQSALGRGMIKQTTFDDIQAKMIAETEKVGGRFDYIAYCPHGPDDGCVCRKPLPGMLLDTFQVLDIQDKKTVVMVGDSYRDVQAAHAAGIDAILVSSGYGDADKIFEKSKVLMPSIQMFANLGEAVGTLIEEKTL
ncbi:D-glycero-alpha-D-manno-heptose-1,7-bisphosphate 7-phosphatase [Ghiorsea bivora]|uniref:D-glycero-alpha-D-manno-heptose-1,7-bisphosphate 7-phosphatase n=1 Tax=Ghiorsea bivora TaxID=1485545 RepID=UPI00056F3212|nr:HAD-IIIA family hydrolase [Ghiorsea bivora]